MGESTRQHTPSYYAATMVDGPAAKGLVGQQRADVCIVGGGYTGLSAALQLAERGRSVALLEAGPVGWGASGRNGGQVHVGMRQSQRWLEKAVGVEDARRLWAMSLDARAHLDHLIQDYRIACDFRPGYLHGDHKRKYVSHTLQDVRFMRDNYGYDQLRFVDRDEIQAMVATSDYFGGSFDARGGHLHPLNLALGIARAARVAGALIFPHSRVTAIRPSQRVWRVETAAGAVLADEVVLACGGYLDGLEPVVDAHVMPINNYIATTTPFGENAARRLINGCFSISDSRFVVNYYRMTPDNRLLFGGGENYSYSFPKNIGEFVRPHMERVFPQLGGVKIEYAWGGTLSVTPTRLPFVREIKPGFFNVSGFSGLGVVLAPYFGKILGDAIAGDRDMFDRLTRLPVPSFPGGKFLRWPTLVAAMTFFAIRDRL